MWARHRALLARREVPTVPAPLVAQSWRGGGHQGRLARTRLMGLTPITPWLTCLLAVRNQRILTPGTPARPTMPAAPPPAYLPKPGPAAARPSPA